MYLHALIERPLLVIVLLGFISGCANREPIITPILSDESRIYELELRNVPFYPQERYQCGPAALAMVLRHSGVMITPDELEPKVFIPAREGSLQLDMIAATRNYSRIPYIIESNLGALIAELQAEHPVLVLQNLGHKRLPVWHYAVVIGYSAIDDEVILHSGTTKRQIMHAKRFMWTWELAGRWAFVILKPGEMPALPDEYTYLKSVAAIERVPPPEILLEAYQAALKRWPDSDLALFSIANTHYMLGDLTAAENTYLRLLAKNPRHTAALNNLAEVLAEQGCLSEALKTISKALEEKVNVLRPALLRTRESILSRKKQAGTEIKTCT